MRRNPVSKQQPTYKYMGWVQWGRYGSPQASLERVDMTSSRERKKKNAGTRRGDSLYMANNRLTFSFRDTFVRRHGSWEPLDDTTPLALEFYQDPAAPLSIPDDVMRTIGMSGYAALSEMYVHLQSWLASYPEDGHRSWYWTPPDVSARRNPRPVLAPSPVQLAAALATWARTHRVMRYARMLRRDGTFELATVDVVDRAAVDALDRIAHENGYELGGEPGVYLFKARAR